MSKAFFLAACNCILYNFAKKINTWKNRLLKWGNKWDWNDMLFFVSKQKIILHVLKHLSSATFPYIQKKNYENRNKLTTVTSWKWMQSNYKSTCYYEGTVISGVEVMYLQIVWGNCYICWIWFRMMSTEETYEKLQSEFLYIWMWYIKNMKQECWQAHSNFWCYSSFLQIWTARRGKQLINPIVSYHHFQCYKYYSFFF
jgi:hypothetical protein